MKFIFLAMFLLPMGLKAQTSTVFSSGLMNPSKLILTAAGNLLVTEVGTAPNSGRVSIVDRSGVRRTLIDGLPSGLAAPNLDPDGPNGLLLQGNSLFILNGEGDGFRNGTKPNTIVPNPAAPSSPILSSLMKLTLPGNVDSAVGGFTMMTADHFRLADGNSVMLKDSAGGTATLDLVTDFRDGVADPVTAWRNSHPYGLAALDGRPDKMYVADAGMNVLWEVTVSTGKYRVLTRFAPFFNPAGTMGPPVSEAVPTSVRAYGDQLLVSFLRGFPFLPGGAQVSVVDPTTGVPTPFIGSLTSAIDVLAVPGAQPLFFTLEFSTDQGATPPAPGRVNRYDSAAGKTILSGLVTPTSLAYDAEAKVLYVLSLAQGTISKIPQ